jgi:carbamoylphosphate synthase large subunit
VSEPIAVTGAGGPAGRAVGGWLRAQGIEPVAVDAHPYAVDWADALRVPPARDPDFIGRLIAVARESGANRIVPTVSEELPILARGRDALRLEGVEILVAGPRAVAVAADKLLTASALAAAGVAVPRFTAIGAAVGRNGVALERLPWPALTKPRVSRGGRGVAVHRGLEELLAAWPVQESILQEFVPGREYAVQLAPGEPDEVVVLEKTALRNGRVGNADSVVRCDESDVAAVALRAVMALGLTGPADVDVRRRASGEPVVLEVNARFGAWAHEAPEVLAAALGAWLPAPVVA